MGNVKIIYRLYRVCKDTGVWKRLYGSDDRKDLEKLLPDLLLEGYAYVILEEYE